MFALFFALNLFSFAQTPTTSAVVPTAPQTSPATATYTLEGTLRERGTRKPLGDVNIYALPSKIKAVSDKNGHFKLANIPSGEVQVIVNLTGYIKFQSTFDLDSSDDDFQIYIEKESYRYFETTISDRRTKKDDTQKTLSQEEFLQMPGSGGDPVKAVQNLPGVNRVSGGDSKVVIQGSEPEDTQYNIDGQNVPLIFHFGGLSSIVMPEAVDSVDYLSAGYGPNFGRALGGHVGLNVRKPHLDRHHGLAFMDLYNIGGLAEGPLSEDSGYMVSARYSYIGYVLQAATKDNKDFNMTVAPTFADINGQYYKKLNDQDEFRIFTIFSRDELKFVLNKPIDNDPKLRGNFRNVTEFYRFIPQWTRQLDASRKISVSAGLGGDSTLVDVGSNYLNIKAYQLTARSEYEQRFNSKWKSQWGLDGIQTWYKADVRIPATFSEGGVSNPLSSGDLRQTNITGQSSVVGLYWKNEVKWAEDSDWTFLPGLRGDYFSVTKETQAQPRLGLRYAIDSTTTLKLMSGLYYQAPSEASSDATFGNPDIKTQRAIHYALGFEKNLVDQTDQRSRFSGNVFYKKLDRLVVNSSNLVERNGQLTPENYNNSGTGHVQGFELETKNKFEKWGLTGSYTYSQSRRQQPGMPEMPSAYDQTHSLNLLMSYEEGPWQYGARLRYVTGNPYTPIVAATYDSDNDVYIPQRGELYSSRNKDFVQLDVRIDRKWVYDTWIFSAYLDVQNLTNQKNQEGVNYSYNYSQKEEVTGLPMLPTLGVKGEF